MSADDGGGSMIGRRRWRTVAAGVLAIGTVVLAGCSVPDQAGQAPHAGRPEVTTDAGKLRGVTDGDVVRFRGVPYAQPPVGDLRWAAPRPVVAAGEVREAAVSGPACAQNAGQLPQQALTEDCLYLEVTAPAAPRAGRPVMVWIHGGSLETGTGAQFDPRSIAVMGDVVVVTINYRLGPFGFLALPGMDPTAGAQGLADQQQALRFVARNAAEFGGDPGNVTVFGESGGGVSTCAHLAAPGSRGLFQRAIVQSAVGACADPIEPGAVGRDVPLTSNFPPLSTVQQSSEAAAARLGCADPATALACLRRVPADRLLAEGGGLNLPAVGGPDTVLPTGPAAAIADGRVAPVPVLQGFVSREPSFFLAAEALAGRALPTAAEYADLVRRGWGRNAGQVLATYPVTQYLSPADAWVAVHADGSWACPSMRLDTALAARGPVYGYEFASPDLPLLPPVPGLTLGATHGAEIAFLFDLPSTPGTPPPPALTPDQKRLSDEMIRVWTTFARTGTAPDIPAWTSQDRRLGVFGQPGRSTALTISDQRSAHHCGMWDAISSAR